MLVIIPTYNESENIDSIVGRLRRAVPAAEVLVADDNSPDGTGLMADALASRDANVHVLHRLGKEGLGAAYLAGLVRALLPTDRTIVTDRIAAGRRLLPGMEDGVRSRVAETTYEALDTPYRRWLRKLSAATDLDDATRRWQGDVRRIVTRAAADLVESAGTPALAGRTVNGRYLNSAIAENFFRAALRQALPYAYPSRQPPISKEEE